MEWKPIETAPKVGMFLAWCGKMESTEKCIYSPEPFVAVFNAITFWDSVGPNAKHFMPIEEAKSATHWMPIPAPPKEAKRTGHINQYHCGDPYCGDCPEQVPND